MISTKKLLYKMLQMPMVVEQGASDGWSYRKWSDGRAECWKRVGILTATNGAYTELFPSGLFNYEPTVQITPWYGLGSDPHRGARGFIVTDGSHAADLVVYFRNADGTNYTGYFGITVNAIGKWK